MESFYAIRKYGSQVFRSARGETEETGQLNADITKMRTHLNLEADQLNLL
jgi:hypothetical protein